MTSPSSALARTSDRVHSRSPWLIVTVLLAKVRPLCITSTPTSSGASGDAPRAKTVWRVLADLPSWGAMPATSDWASSWPPKTTPRPLATTCTARYWPSPAGSSSSAPTRSPTRTTGSGGDGVVDPHQPGQVAAHDLLDVLLRESLGQAVDVAARLGQALGVRVVRPEQHVVGAHRVDEGVEVVLVERVDPDVALEGLDRILVEPLGHHLVGVGEVAQERVHPVGPVLDERHLQVREPGEGAVAGEGRHGVLDGPLADRHPAEGVGLERQVLLGPGPVGLVAGVAAVGGVHGDEDPGIDHRLPERVELLEAEGAGALVAGHGSGPDQHGAGAPLHTPLQLLDGLLDDGQRDDRRGEDAALVVEGPLLVHPLVEGVDDDVGELGIVPEALLQQAGQCREHE